MSKNTKHAIITGGSSGIGFAIARCLLTRGYDLTLIARTAAKLSSAKAKLAKLTANNQIRCVAGDVCDQDFIHACFQEVTANYSSTDLYCSAGIAHPGYFTELPTTIFEQTMQINYFGSLYAVRALLACQKPQTPAHIILISSAAALMGVFGYGAYAPSKFALIGLAEVLYAELRQHNMAISIAYPPDTLTPQLDYEEQFKPAETRRITQYAGKLTPEYVADRIIHAALKGKFAITFNYQTALLYRLGNLIKPLLRWQFNRISKA